MHRFLFALLALTYVALAAPALELKKGDHVAIVGGGFADRMQHPCYYEAVLHQAHREHELVIRNLAAAGDEVTTWHRSQDFGSQDEWLKRVEANVILAFWGFNESFQGADGLTKFKDDLSTWIDGKRGQTFGKEAPRIALFSPVAAEETGNPDLPRVAPLNANLALYAKAVQEVAAEKELPFVDLYQHSLQIYERTETQLTVNGLHLIDDGYNLLSGLLAKDLFLLSQKHLPSSACDEKTAKKELIVAFVKHIMEQRAAGAEDLAAASGVERISRTERSSGSTTAANVVSLQNSLSEIRAIAGPLVLEDSCYLSAGLLGPLAVQALCTIVTGQLSLYRTVHSRVNAGSALPHNERYFRALVVEFRSSLDIYEPSAIEKAIGYVPIGTISFMCLLQALQLRSGASAQQALEGLRHVDLHLGQKGFSLTPLYSYLKSCEATLAKSGSPAIDSGQLAESLFLLHDAPLRN